MLFLATLFATLALAAPVPRADPITARDLVPLNDGVVPIPDTDTTGLPSTTLPGTDSNPPTSNGLGGLPVGLSGNKGTAGNGPLGPIRFPFLGRLDKALPVSIPPSFDNFSPSNSVTELLSSGPLANAIGHRGTEGGLLKREAKENEGVYAKHGAQRAAAIVKRDVGLLNALPTEALTKGLENEGELLAKKRDAGAGAGAHVAYIALSARGIVKRAEGGEWFDRASLASGLTAKEY